MSTGASATQEMAFPEVGRPGDITTQTLRCASESSEEEAPAYHHSAQLAREELVKAVAHLEVLAREQQDLHRRTRARLIEMHRTFEPTRQELACESARIAMQELTATVAGLETALQDERKLKREEGARLQSLVEEERKLHDETRARWTADWQVQQAQQEKVELLSSKLERLQLVVREEQSSHARSLDQWEQSVAELNHQSANVHDQAREVAQSSADLSQQLVQQLTMDVAELQESIRQQQSQHSSNLSTLDCWSNFVTSFSRAAGSTAAGLLRAVTRVADPVEE